MRGGDQPRPVVSRPDRHPHPGLRGREPGLLLRGELPGLRGGQEEAARSGRATADADPLQTAGPELSGLPPRLPGPGSLSNRRCYFAFFFELLLAAAFTSTCLAVIVYSMVTLSPG